MSTKRKQEKEKLLQIASMDTKKPIEKLMEEFEQKLSTEQQHVRKSKKEKNQTK